MKTIRRLYFYLVSLISLEVVIWGLINLLRTTFSSGLTFPGADTLAQALALIFVGVPIFSAHWIWSQRVSQKDPEELSATLRALFLYATLLMTIIPVVQNLLALINRSLIVGAGIDSYRSFLGGSQTWIDNIIAILLNLLVAFYFFNTLRTNWRSLESPENFTNIRRIFRYIWVLYALFMTVFGVQQVVRFLFYFPNAVLGAQGREMYINGLALILVGTPIWVYTWTLCQNALEESGERGSTLRLAVLYILSLVGVSAVLTTAGIIVNTLLLRLLGSDTPWRELVSQIGGPFSVGFPLAIVWAYYGSWLSREIASYSEVTRRSALMRFYYHILSLIGLVSTFVGLALLLSFIVSLLTSTTLWGDVLRARLCGSLATLISGLPLWIFAWRPIQSEALLADDLGDHARRSLVRRAYLYLAIFATVIGGMASAIYLVYTVLFGFLDHRSDSFLTDVFNGIQLLGLFIAFLLYHWNVMRQDGGRAADALASRQANFAVLIFESQDLLFAGPVVNAIRRASASIPVAVQAVEQGIPDGAEAARAVVLPSSLALDPPEALRLWLRDYSGSKIIIPINQTAWYWPGGPLKNGPEVTAQIIRQLAEGQEVRTSSSAPAWQVAAYVCAVFFGLELLFLLFALGMSLTGH